MKPVVEAPLLFEGMDDELGSITLAELNGEFLSVDGSEQDEEKRAQYHAVGGMDFPALHVPPRLERNDHMSQIYARPPQPTLWESIVSNIPWLQRE